MGRRRLWRHLAFPAALLRLDIATQSDENRSPQARLLSPSDEAHVRDKLRFGPESPLVSLGNFVEGALVAFKSVQLLHQKCAHLLVHSRAGMSDEAKRFTLVKAE